MAKLRVNKLPPLSVQIDLYVMLQWYKKPKKLFKNKKRNPIYTRKQPLMVVYQKSESTRDSVGKFTNQFQPKTKTLIRKLDKDKTSFII